MKKIEFSYSREKLIKLLLPALELLMQTKDMEGQIEFLNYKISQIPLDKDDELKEVPPPPVMKNLKKKYRSPFFNFILNFDLIFVSIGMVISFILGAASLLTTNFYDGVVRTIFVVASIVFFAIFVGLIGVRVLQTIFTKINKLDESHNDLAKSAKEDYEKQLKKIDDTIRENRSTIKRNAYLAAKRKEYYSNVKNWESGVQDLKNKLALNYECINETLDFLPDRHRNVDSVSRILTILKENRAENLKDALNLLEDILHKEKVLKIEQERYTLQEQQAFDEKMRREEEESMSKLSTYYKSPFDEEPKQANNNNAVDNNNKDEYEHWRNSTIHHCWRCKLKPICHANPFTCNGPIEK